MYVQPQSNWDFTCRIIFVSRGWQVLRTDFQFSPGTLHILSLHDFGLGCEGPALANQQPGAKLNDYHQSKADEKACEPARVGPIGAWHNAIWKYYQSTSKACIKVLQNLIVHGRSPGCCCIVLALTLLSGHTTQTDMMTWAAIFRNTRFARYRDACSASSMQIGL